MASPPLSSVPDPDLAPPVPESVRPDSSSPPDALPPAGGGPNLTHVPPESRPAVRRLHAQVERAATALERLQRENERLRRRLAALEQRPALQPDTTTLVLDDEPQDLRARLSSFIDTIDAFLSDDAPAPSSASPPSS